MENRTAYFRPIISDAGIDALGYEPDQKQLFMDALAKPQGMLLITGPTGSGKNRLLVTPVQYLKCRLRPIFTAEDPVEDWQKASIRST